MLDKIWTFIALSHWTATKWSNLLLIYSDTSWKVNDDALFRSISSNTSHVLHTFLSERPETTYSLRTRRHNKLLIPKTSDLDDRHFIIRSLYKNWYRCDLTLQTKLLCWHCCIYAELLLHFILARPICVVLYTFMNFVHSCVWQLFLKNKRWDEIILVFWHQQTVHIDVTPFT